MNKKTSAFYMRASRDDKMQIVKLAKRLRVSKTEAVRRAIIMALNAHPGHESQLINQPRAQV